MIITCPSCEKRYLIESSYITEKGRQVRCGDCGNTWWQEAIEILNLDPHREGVHERDRLHHNLSLNKLDKSIEEENKPRGIKAFIQNYYLDWIVIILALCVVLFVVWREGGTFFDPAPSLKRVINPRAGGNQKTQNSNLMVQGINYDATHHNNMPHLIVTGELVNVSAKSLQVPPLTITISGKHNGQDMPPRSHKWRHANKEEQLLPGGRIAFQTITPHPGWSNIDKIDVAY